MSTLHEPTDTTNDDDIVALEPTIAFGSEGGPGLTPMPAVGIVAGAAASLAGETRSLHRSRLSSAAIILVLLYFLLFLWNLATDIGDRQVVLTLFGARLALAAVVAAIALSPLELKPVALRVLEYVLFGGMTALLLLALIVVDTDLIEDGDLPRVIAYWKNGVIQIFILMTLYGMYIPNTARRAAGMVLTMALVPFVAGSYLSEQRATAAGLAQYDAVEPLGSNLVFTAIGAVMAIYGAHILSGLRTDLHQARKFGQYQLHHKIGAGGMGEVYYAEHELLKRPCAIKLIRSESTADPLALARFEREVRSAARLSHHNTIEIYDYGHTDDGTFYYVMELLKGMSLADIVARFGPLPPGRAVFLLRQTCAGLAEAHALGLVHRDLKPANLFVALHGGEHDVIKILDFGLVKLTSEPESTQLTADQTVSGTPMYMAPEQAKGDRHLDARADIYALGAVAYHILTGRPPFEGKTAIELLIAHARDTAVAPSKLRPEIPAELDAIVMRCLAKDPAQRFASVRELDQALAACPVARDWDMDRAADWWAREARERMPHSPSPG